MQNRPMRYGKQEILNGGVFVFMQNGFTVGMLRDHDGKLLRFKKHNMEMMHALIFLVFLTDLNSHDQKLSIIICFKVTADVLKDLKNSP